MWKILLRDRCVADETTRPEWNEDGDGDEERKRIKGIEHRLRCREWPAKSFCFLGRSEDGTNLNILVSDCLSE